MLWLGYTLKYVHCFFFKQEAYQDPTSINVDSEDFQSLPAEIQHELIQEMKEDRKFMSKNDMPGV